MTLRGIDQIVIRNFKAFNDEFTIKIGGKNLLLYGENGSGKSSIYWALYTLLQSSHKSVERIQKYFSKENDENLLNVFSQDAISHVKISLIDSPDNWHKVSHSGIAPKNADDKNDILDSLNMSCDFITHRLLTNFFNFRNSKEINLWAVFEHDIIPFLKADQDHSEDSLNDRFNEIVNNLPYNKDKKGNFRHKTEYKYFLDAIKSFNDDLKFWLAQMNQDITNLYRENFRKPEDPDIEIQLMLEKELRYELYQQTRTIDGESQIFTPAKGLNEIFTPIIKLSIGIKQENGETIPIKRPQSFLNEARLTAIALSIRFLLLDHPYRTLSNNSFLVLDDLLVSLDMNNRDLVLTHILENITDHQIILLTHDRSFFNYAQQKIKRLGHFSKWVHKEMFPSISSSVGNNPDIYDLDDKTQLDKAEYHLSKHDYPACGIYLRKECETILDRLLPKNKQYLVSKNDSGIYETQCKCLNDKLLLLEDFCNKEEISFTPFKDLIIYKSVILNSLAHNDLNSPLYHTELVKILNVLKNLSNIKRDLVVRCKKDVKIQLIKPDGNPYIIGMQLRDSIKALTVNGSAPRLSKICKVNIKKIIDDKDEQIVNTEELSLHKILNDHCERINIEVPNLEDVLSDRDGVFIDKLIF